MYRFGNLCMYTFTFMFHDVAILPACACQIPYGTLLISILFSTSHHRSRSLTLDGEVRHHILIMSSHAPGEGGKNAPVQITEGPSVARSLTVIAVLT